MLKILPKMLSGISLNFHLLCSPDVPIMPFRLATILAIIFEHFNQ